MLGLALSKDGQTLATADTNLSPQSTLRVWHRQGTNLVQIASITAAKQNEYTAIAFSADTTTMIATTDTGVTAGQVTVFI
jgi:hypothetical protein